MNYIPKKLYSFVYHGKKRLGRFDRIDWIHNRPNNQMRYPGWWNGGHWTASFVMNKEEYKSFIERKMINVRKATILECIFYMIGWE